MKKIISILLPLFLLASCNSEASLDNKTIPLKVSQESNDVISSPINSSNLDDYMFLDNVQYVDLRTINMILNEGYVAGFEFIPFYNVICSFTDSKTLYTMKATTIEGKVIPAGQVGSFEANYVESQDVIESYFSKTKYIFFISQGGSESSYMINLLLQLGYDGNKLYNVGGVSNSEGRTPYKNVEGNKYYVSPGFTNINFTFEFTFKGSELTPIKEKN